MGLRSLAVHYPSKSTFHRISGVRGEDRDVAEQLLIFITLLPDKDSKTPTELWAGYTKKVPAVVDTAAELSCIEPAAKANLVRWSGDLLAEMRKRKNFEEDPADAEKFLLSKFKPEKREQLQPVAHFYLQELKKGKKEPLVTLVNLLRKEVIGPKMLDSAKGPPAPAPESPQSSPGGSPRYHRVKLEIEVVRATDLPSAALLSTSDPYVVVSIVDGHPLQDPEALKGYEDWRSVHEQFSGQTRVAEGTNPEFRARFLAEVRNREQTHIHFRLLDQDSISHADREIGQAVLPLVDVLGESWAAVRAIALRPMDRTNAQAWAAISKTRLHVAVISEGILGRVKNEEQIQRAAAKWQVQAHGRRAARPRADQETGLLDFFG
ncbi:unnamed protein product [Durusdinium trenchii]|uniref:C2 domain-containing protein n=1 Tax=Durusdinium trenchii TaxID=1381693 RepID=A0ABP0PY30_9DINO